MQNAVQTFSLQNTELLDAAPVHPSPPTVFAVSPGCDLLVSASADPPIIYLSRLAYKQPPLLFVPNCSATPVIVMAFHPTRSSVFALGFQDGTIAAYDATVVSTIQVVEDRYSFARIYGEISHILRLHEPAPGPLEIGDQFNKNNQRTISAIHFLSDQPCSVVTIGSDGKCCMVRFEKAGLKSSKVIEDWHLNSPATSLAVLRTEHTTQLPQSDGTDNMKDNADASPVLLAIGKNDGTVGIYNQTGELLAFRDFSMDGRILDLEWIARSRDRTKTKQDPEDIPETKPEIVSPPLIRAASVPLLASSPEKSLRSSRSSIGSKIMIKLHAKELPSDDYLLRRQHSMQNIAEESNENPASGLDGNSTSTLRESTKIEDLEVRPVMGDFYQERVYLGKHVELQKTDDLRSFDARKKSRYPSHNTTSSRGSRKSTKKSRIPAIPPRPVPRPGGRLALRRMETARGRRPSTSHHQSIVPKEIVRAVTTGQPQFRNINHAAFARPRAVRQGSSLISPLSEASEPYLTPMAYISPRKTPPITDGLHNQRSQTAPVQYDRLIKTSWDAESITTTSHSSIVAVSGFRPVTSTKTKPVGPKDIKLGAVSQLKANQVEVKTVPPGYMSDSGTSVGSVLDWTPGQIQRPTYISRGAPAKATLEPPKIPPRPHFVAWEDSQLSSTKINPSSDGSSVSRLDWRSDPQPIAQVSLGNINPEQPMGSPTLRNSQDKGIHGNRTGIDSALGAQSFAPLHVPTLRKQETVINLKEKQKESFNAQSQAAEPVVVLTESGDPYNPGPDMKSTEDAGKISNLLPGTRIASISFSAPQSSMSPTTRRSSHFRSPLDLSQPRSGSTAGSQSMYTIEDVIRIECAAICARIDIAFEEQKGWLQGCLKDQNWYTQRLEEENGKFRDELARLRR